MIKYIKGVDFMNDRRNIFEQFEKQKDYLNEKINFGIENYRKGYGKIQVKDKAGNVIPDVKIKLKQKKHEFKFGANLFLLDELESQEKNDLYKKYFKDVFNMATLPFYWNATEPEKGKLRYNKDSEKLYRRPSIDLCMEFCQKHGIEPREHGLAYEQFFPKWLSGAPVAEVKAELERRYKEISDRYKDKIPTIEVTNEMAWKKGATAFYDEPDFIEWCFKLAEKYFPGNQLVINEGAPLAFKEQCRTSARYYSYIEVNMLKGARIDAIGMQYHMFCSKENEYEYTRLCYDPKKLYDWFDLYARFGKPLHITEVTIPAHSWDEEDEKIQAELIEILYSIWFSHPAMEQIVYWNLADGYAYVADPNPEKIKASQGDMTLGENIYHGGLLRFDMTPKPAYYTIKNLIQNKWHTEIDVVTDNEGVARFKGFYGEYDMEVTVDERCVKNTINLYSKGDNKFEICL